MERETRLELATSSLARTHSTTELLPQFNLQRYNTTVKKIFQPKFFVKFKIYGIINFVKRRNFGEIPKLCRNCNGQRPKSEYRLIINLRV